MEICLHLVLILLNTLKEKNKYDGISCILKAEQLLKPRNQFNSFIN